MSDVNAAAPAGDVYDWYTRGMRLLGSGDAAAAAALLEHAARAEPASCSVREALARALFDSGRYADARAAFAANVDESPADDYAQFGLGLSHVRMGELDEAVEHLAIAAAPRQVAHSLCGLGVQADEAEVLTSSTATAALLAERLPPGSRVLVVGGDGLREPLRACGLVPVASADDEPAAVVQGWSPDLTWALLAEGAVAIRRGCPWVATNRDATLPSPRGPLPGNGAMVSAVAMAAGAEPEVVGKPGRALFDAAVRRTGAARALVIGDRLDTDIAGANAAGLDSLLVLTGVSGPDDLLKAAPEHRPTYVGRDLSALLGPLAPITGEGRADDGLDDLRGRARASWARPR